MSTPVLVISGGSLCLDSLFCEKKMARNNSGIMFIDVRKVGYSVKMQELPGSRSDLEEIIREIETLISEFQRLFQETGRKTYSVFRFFRKNRNADNYGKFYDIDKRLGKMLSRFDRFRTTNMSHFSPRMKAYMEAYGEYLRSVKVASELRVEFELRFMNFNLSPSTGDDLDRTEKLMVMISSSLETSERNAQKVNAVVQSFGGSVSGADSTNRAKAVRNK